MASNRLAAALTAACLTQSRSVGLCTPGTAAPSSSCRLSLNNSLLRVTLKPGPKKRAPLIRWNTSSGSVSLLAALRFVLTACMLYRVVLQPAQKVFHAWKCQLSRCECCCLTPCIETLGNWRGAAGELQCGQCWRDSAHQSFFCTYCAYWNCVRQCSGSEVGVSKLQCLMAQLGAAMLLLLA